jgi:hypothetical protein
VQRRQEEDRGSPATVQVMVQSGSMEARGLVVELGSSSSLSGLSSFSFLISSFYFNFFFSVLVSFFSSARSLSLSSLFCSSPCPICLCFFVSSHLSFSLSLQNREHDKGEERTGLLAAALQFCSRQWSEFDGGLWMCTALVISRWFACDW